MSFLPLIGLKRHNMNEWCEKYVYRCLIKNNKLKSQYLSLLENRPKEKRIYFQGIVTIESAICRICFLQQKLDLANKEIVFLGDDDLVSLGLSLTSKETSICVIDIDDEILEFIQLKSRGAIKVIHHDLKNELPSHLIGKFDVFVTDPHEDLDYFLLFLKRGFQLLKADGEGVFGISNNPNFLRKNWLPIQKFILDNGFIFTDMIFKFNKYVNWGTSAWTKIMKV